MNITAIVRDLKNINLIRWDNSKSIKNIKKIINKIDYLIIACP